MAQDKLQFELKKIDAKIAAGPPLADAHFERGALLMRLGRVPEAQAAYFEALKLDSRHLGALTNLGTLLFETNYLAASLRAYREIIRHYPSLAAGYVLAANALYKSGARADARAHFEKALALDPGHAEAHQNLGALLIEMGEIQLGWEHRKLGFKDDPYISMPYRGSEEPLRLLVLASGIGGNIPFRQVLESRPLDTRILVAEFFNPTLPLPPHQVIWNVIGDAERCQDALEAALGVLQHSSAPVINHPQSIFNTGRVEGTKRLTGIPGLLAPTTVLLSRETLCGGNAAAELQRLGLGFPLLVRAPGFHEGKHFAKIDSPGELGAALAAFPGSEFVVIQHLDGSAADGKFRKYRVMMIDGKLYPLHLAVSARWKIHYFSADMAEHPEHRAEDKAFLEDMPGVLGPKAMATLTEIQKTLGLDYAGIDFGLNRSGDILLFEANATMGIYAPSPGEEWAYRRAPVQRAMDAAAALIIGKAESKA